MLCTKHYITIININIEKHQTYIKNTTKKIWRTDIAQTISGLSKFGKAMICDKLLSHIANNKL